MLFRSDEAKGEGLGKVLWEKLSEDNPNLHWRARPNNSINDFYFKKADGCIKKDEWNIFWYGLDDFDKISQCVMQASQKTLTVS